MNVNFKLTQICLSAVIITAASTNAFAQDWSGAYAGISLSQHQGDYTDYINNEKVVISGVTWPAKRSGDMVGLYGGYRIQTGSFVVGPELAFRSGDLTYELAPGNKIPNLKSLGVKAGYILGNSLVSIGASYFSGSISPTSVETNGKADFSGTEFSIGFDYLVTDDVTLGLVATTRSFDGARYSLVQTDYETRAEDSSIELRLGYNF